ncbi:MAG: DUF368 domain-containing protein [Arachnia sp.]
MHVLRGVLMGLAELVPGVSGGTIALITGVYVRIIDSANHVVTAARRLVTGPDRLRSFRAEFARAEWTLIVPLLLGMGTAVVSMAGIMHQFVKDQSELARGLFLGMVAVSIAVPLLLVDRRELRSPRSRARAAALFLTFAILTFILTSQGGSAQLEDPSKPFVFAAAAVAICALVLPGVSGSFLLLVVGLYGPTTLAAAELDLGYLAVFAAGAVLGLGVFVKGLQWLLHNHHTLTMVSMAALMLGSLRALWPWQAADGAVLAPGDDWPGVLLLLVVGAVGVLTLVILDRKLSGSETPAPAEPVIL